MSGSSTGYVAPENLDEALSLLAANPSCALIAGGTDLIPQLRAGHPQPDVLVDLRRLPLHGIDVEDEQVRLGARVTFTDLFGSEIIGDEYPALIEAAAEVGGPPIRNRATLGGNLANASPAADSAPALLVYDASVIIAGSQGERAMALSEFFEGPGRTLLLPGEILTEIVMPRWGTSTHSSFVKLGPRNAMAVSVVSAAVRVTGDGLGGISECRVALGAVAPVPMRAVAAEEIIVVEGLTPSSILSAAAAAALACSPIDDLRGSADYRRRMVEVLVRRLLSGLAEDSTDGLANV